MAAFEQIHRRRHIGMPDSTRPTPVKILTVGTLALVVLAAAILLSAKALVTAIAYREIGGEVQVGQSTL